MTILKPETVQSILKDFTTAKLCTYQIAHKLNINQRTIKSVIIKNMGQAVFDKKESLAYSNLVSEIKTRVEKNIASYQIACDIGISRSSCLRIIEKLPLEDTGDVSSLSVNPLVIAVENDAEKKPAKANTPELPASPVTSQSTSQNTSTLNNIIQISQVQESHVSASPHSPVPAPYSHCNYSRRNHYSSHNIRPYQNRSNRGNFPDSRQHMVSINLNGFLIRFDSNKPGASDILNKIIKAIME